MGGSVGCPRASCSSQAHSGPGRKGSCWQRAWGPFPTFSELCALWVSRRPLGPLFCEGSAGCNWEQLCQALPLRAHRQKPQKPVAKLLCQTHPTLS